MTIQLIKGFKDILPGEVELWQHIEKSAKKLLSDFGFSEIRIPIMEKTNLFKRSIGENTDIVEKEMYTFEDKKGSSITLRPEATASVVRSYIQHKMYAKGDITKLYTIGPMFRRERPQKGRYRQFHQINAEIFGEASSFIDAQLIIILYRFMSILGIDDAKTHINSLGCPVCRPDFMENLKSFIENIEDKLCADCKRRAHKNPLRVLDCKVPSCKELLSKAPAISDFLCKECFDHFDIVKNFLNDEGVPFIIDKRLVRGLDYYTKTTFEIQTGALGAQNAIAGGGRYDGLVKILGGPDTHAAGFAIGFERVAEILSLKNPDYTKKPDIFIAALGEEPIKKAFSWHNALSINGIKTHMNFSVKSLKSLMKTANKMNARFVIIAGEDELVKKAVILRNMKTKEQIDIKIDNFLEEIRKNL
jgi:histidyl-tRNA synthetase